MLVSPNPMKMGENGTPTSGGANATSSVIPLFRVIEPTPIKALPNSTATPLFSSPTAIPSSHRVLYRGSLCFLSSEQDVPLEGISFIAHFDPASPARRALFTADLPLALESQRGLAALNIISVIPTASFDDRLDDSIDVQMYIHPQSLITRAYFERLLCMNEITRPDGRTLTCLRVRLGDNEDGSGDIAIYGQCSLEQPTLRIRVARILPPPRARAPPAPRPDDPLPRSARFPNLIPASRKRRSSSPDPNPTFQSKKSSSSSSVTSKDRSRPSIATHAKSFRIGSGSVPNPNSNTSSSSSSSNGLVRTKSSHARQKSSLSVVSTIHDEDEDRDEDVDVFGTSSDAELAGRDRPRGLFYKPTGKTPGKPSASGSKGSLVGVTTEEDSLNRANKETIKRMAISLLNTNGVSKEHDEFKELYQVTVKGATFALRALMNERRIERDEIKRIVQLHLDMYLPDTEADISLFHPMIT